MPRRERHHWPGRVDRAQALRTSGDLQSDLIATVPQSVGTLFSHYPGIHVFPVPFADPITPPTATVIQYWTV